MEISPKSATGFYEWVVPNFNATAGRLKSPIFEVGGYCWRLLFFPHGSTSASLDHASLFLHCPEAHTFPLESQLCPDVAFSFKIKNNKDQALDHVKDSQQTLNSKQVDWGFWQLIERSKLTADSGFLTPDGSVILQLELEVKNPRLSTILYSDLNSTGLGTEFLSLLDDSEGTSDLTVIVGPGNGSAAGGSASGSDSRGGGGDDEATSTTPGSGQPQRSFRVHRAFHVHRAVLAARCPFFRTLFNAGMADSAAAELPLPDADPDAFAVLLRYLYGGEVPYCERAVHRAAIVLCDKLLLPKVKEALERRLVDGADASTIFVDLLWASQAGQECVLEELVAVYKRVAKDVDPAQVMAMATTWPQLVRPLLIGVTQQEQEGQEAGGGRKRARE